jgi:hypothetical protein
MNGDINPGRGKHLEPLRNMLAAQVQAEEFSGAIGKAKGQSKVWFRLHDLLAGHPWQVDMVDGIKALISSSRNPHRPSTFPCMDILMYLAVMLLHDVILMLLSTKVETKAARVPDR